MLFHFILCRSQLRSTLSRHSLSACLTTFRFKSSAIRRQSTLPRSPLFEALLSHDPASTAVVHSRSGRAFTYGQLVHDVAVARKRLCHDTNKDGIAGERIAFLAENSYDYVVTFLSIIANSAVALPIAHSFPDSEIRYILEDSAASVFLASNRFREKAHDVLRPQNEHQPLLCVLPKIEVGSTSAETPRLDNGTMEDGGFMLYTSGTTNRPKGVILSSAMIAAQARSLMEAWQYQSSDLVLHTLPLHHIHGTINALYVPLMAGSTIEFTFPFNADAVWQRLAQPFSLSPGQSARRPVTFFTAVPTIYSKLLSEFPRLDHQAKANATRAVSPEYLRLNISGSAALPTTIKDAWTKLSNGNVLLERYGMTEVGMALSCGLDPADRVDGSVGWPLPSVEVRLMDIETGTVIELGEEIDAKGNTREGEIQLRGPTIFEQYWQNPKATAEEFVEAGDGRGKWFKTGDVAVRRSIPTAGGSDQAWAKGPMYFIRGRKSVDIIKTGGEKVSALEIERELLSIPFVTEAAVVGIDSEQWGQRIAAVIALTEEGKSIGKGGKPWGAMDMRRALKEKLASYKIPQEVKIVDSIPRNAMGKVNKKSLVQELYPISK